MKSTTHLYIKLKSCPSVCLSIRLSRRSLAWDCWNWLQLPNAVNLLSLWGNALISLHSAAVEDEVVEKTRATFHRKPQPYSSTGRAADMHSGGRGFKSSWWTLFFSKISTFCMHVFLKSSFDSTFSWHFKHASKRDLSKIKCTPSENLTIVIANWYTLLFVLSLQHVEGTGVERRQRTAVVHSCQNHTDRTVVNQLGCGFNASLSHIFFFSFWTFKPYFFSVITIVLSFCFDT